MNLSGSSPYVTLSGAAASDFSVTTPPSATIAASGSTTFVVTFDPSAAGTRTAALSIANDDSDENPYNFTIQGDGFTPKNLIVSGITTPAAGNGIYTHQGILNEFQYWRHESGGYYIYNDEFSGSRYWNIDTDTDDTASNFYSNNHNEDASPVNVTSWQAETGNAGTPLIVYAGPEIRIRGNSVEIVDGDVGPDTTDHTDFGSADIATGSVVRTFTIENLGVVTLSLTDPSPYVVITGATSDFSLTQIPANSMAASSSTTFQVTFNPTSTGLRSATISIANNDGDENPYHFSIQGNGIGAPSVTTSAASSVATTSATGNGNITATNGGNATVRGVIYYAYTNTDKVIGDAGVTNVSEAGNFGTGAFTASLTPLSVNTQYNARAYATSPNGTGYGVRVAFWTLANVPSAPTVNNATATTLDVTVNVNGNPTGTEFCIQETSTGKYVQADGTLGVGQVWQNAATWGTKTVTGLSAGTTYTFQVKARNSGSTETSYGATASLTVCLSSATVTNANDSGAGSLRQAISDICAGGTIDFNLAAGPQVIILTSGELAINKNMTISGPGANDLSVERSAEPGTPDFRIFNIAPASDATISGMTIRNGSAPNGGGLYNSGTLTVTGCEVSGNHGTAHGGPGYGGGIWSNGALTITDSTLRGNEAGSAGGFGGCIYAIGTVDIKNSTLSANQALFSFGGGGAIYLASSGSALTVTNSTLYGNGTESQGGGIYSDSGASVTLYNSIIAGNTKTGPVMDNCSGTITDGGHNIEDDATCSLGASSMSNTDPKLDPLGLKDNGGPTKTIALLPGSPAIDASSTNCPATDQRGVTRSSPNCDIGAFESRGFSFGTPTGSPQSAVINTAFGAPLGVAVTSAFGEPVDGGVIAFTAPASGPSTTFAPMTNAAITGGAVSLGVTANGTAGGPYGITASANGVSGTATFSLTNEKIPATTSILSSANPSVHGQSITFTATVTSGATGTVAFTEGATIHCAASAIGGTTATCSTSALSVGNHTITATYSGDENYNGSSGTVDQAVNRSDITVTITADSPDPSTIGQAVTVSYTVTPVAPGSGTPTGNVTVSDGVSDCTATVAVGSCSLNLTTAGARTLTAAYTGDANFNGSSGTAPHAVLFQYLLSVSISGSGTITGSRTGVEGNGIDCGADCSETYNEGTAVTLTATPANGSAFSGWSGDPDCTDGQATVNAPMTCTAAFNLVTTVTIPAAAGNGTITLTTESPGCGFYSVSAKTEAQVGSDASYDYLYGLVEFTLSCAAADVTITFPGDISDKTYRKYGPTTPGNAATAAWYDFNNVTVNSSTSITLHLQDGQLGDDTGVDGIIVDQGGPGQALAAAAIPTMTDWGMIILIVLLGIGPVYYFRRRRLAI